jgi:hypothetical protein
LVEKSGEKTSKFWSKKRQILKKKPPLFWTQFRGRKNIKIWVEISIIWRVFFSLFWGSENHQNLGVGNEGFGGSEMRVLGGHPNREGGHPKRAQNMKKHEKSAVSRLKTRNSSTFFGFFGEFPEIPQYSRLFWESGGHTWFLRGKRKKTCWDQGFEGLGGGFEPKFLNILGCFGGRVLRVWEGVLRVWNPNFGFRGGFDHVFEGFGGLGGRNRGSRGVSKTGSKK